MGDEKDEEEEESVVKRKPADMYVGRPNECALWYTSWSVNVCFLLTRHRDDTFYTGRVPVGMFPEHYSLCAGLCDVTVSRLIMFPNFLVDH